MSKRPRIKQADGSLLDLPLDAETIKGKKLDDLVQKDEDGYAEINGIYNISSLDSRNKKNGIIFNNVGYEVLLYSEEAKIGLATPDMIGGGDAEHFIHFPDTGRNGNGTFNSYEWSLPAYGGTILTDSMPIYTNNNITTSKNLEIYSDEDSDSELQPKNNDDIDATYYSKGILLYNNDTGEEHRLYYPEKTGTLALLEDLENIGGGGSGSSIELVATGTIFNSDTYQLSTNLENNKLYAYEVITESGYNITGTFFVNSNGMAEFAGLVYYSYDDATRRGMGVYSNGKLTFYLMDSDIEDSSTTPYTTLNIYEVRGGTSSSNNTSSGGLKLVESGTTTYDQETLVLQKPLENNKVYVINVVLADGGLSFIVTVSYGGIVTSTTPYYGVWGDYGKIECYDLKTIRVHFGIDGTSSGYEDFGEGTYEIYELAGGTSSAGAKLRKENYISSIRRREQVVSDFEDGVISGEPFIRFTQPVDIVVETPRTRTFKTNTASKPSLYRPIGGQRIFMDKEYLTFGDIFKLLFINFDFSTIDEVYNPSQASLGGRFRYLVFRDSQYSLENRLSSENIDVKGFYNKRVMFDFFNRERWISKQMTFILKPVINYEEIENDYGNHYTYLTGSHAIEIQIVLSYANRDSKNPNNNLQYLINYKIVELD